MSVRVVPDGTGFLVCRGERALHSPAGATMKMPVEPLAVALAEELAGAASRTGLGGVPLRRLTILALDRVQSDRETFLSDVLAYANADLLLHRAEAPPELVRRQAACWDPVVRWAAKAHGAELRTCVGVRPVNQPEPALEALATAVRVRLSRTCAFDFALAALGEMTMLSGSLLLALATASDRLPAEEAWFASIVDEVWQSEQWGVDLEAEAARDRRRIAFLAAAEVMRMIDRRRPAAEVGIQNGGVA